MIMLKQKGFTLIELLVVIAIVAILSVVVILTLNPAELLKQSRDSNRISDMATLKSAVSLYLADVTSPVLVTTSSPGQTIAGAYNICYASNLAASTTLNVRCGVASPGPGSAQLFATSGAITGANATTSRAVNGTGWLPVNFTTISSGAPVGNLPIDPTNSGGLYYAYAASSTILGFEIDVAAVESSKYGASGGSNIVTVDGGDNNTAFETGNAPGLAL